MCNISILLTHKYLISAIPSFIVLNIHSAKGKMNGALTFPFTVATAEIGNRYVDVR